MKFLHVLTLFVALGISDIAALSESRQDDMTSRGKRSTESSSYFFYQQPEYPRDCKEVYDQCEAQSADGVYQIKPESSPEPFEVYCNNSVEGGGWTVFQRRIDGSVDFYRYWNDYKNGFGFLRREFWLGNDKLSYLTNQKTYGLRIDVNNASGQPYFAKYNLFRISDEGSKYRLVGLGDYDSASTTVHPIGYDALNYHRNQSFSTRDQDNDRYSTYHCASYNSGGWWYNDCEHADLNALYYAGSNDDKSIGWNNLPGGRYHLKYSKMKIRPLQDS